MKLTSNIILSLIAAWWSRGIEAQIVPLAEEPCPALFGGVNQTFSVAWLNASDRMTETAVRFRLYQASSATVAPIDSPQDWKRMEILPRQTVLESVSLTLPSVRVETRFLLQWQDASNHVLGITSLMIYPTNLLQALGPLAGEKAIGVFNPDSDLQSLLSGLGMEYENLRAENITQFHGRLAIIGTFSKFEAAPEKLVVPVVALAKSGVAVVWIQPPIRNAPQMAPSLYIERIGRGTVAVLPSAAMVNLANSPAAQLNLIRASELALKPDSLSLLDNKN